MEETFTGLDIAKNESVCPRCNLVYPTTTFVNGICRDHDQ